VNTRLRLHAIYLSLSDAAFFEASVRSIYNDVDRITVTTTYDRDWKGVNRDPDGVVELILSRRFDPERKIDLIVGDETNEARSRNRAMDYAHPRRQSTRVQRQHADDGVRSPVDYFLIIDPDEIYEEGTLPRLVDYAAQRRLPIYRVAAVRYFKRWCYRIDGLEWSTALVRADVRFTHLRNRKIPLWRRVSSRIPLLPRSAAVTIRRSEDVPAGVGVFHHGSYVGPRERIAEKLGSFGHADEVEGDWMSRIWDEWTPATRNFNPAWPKLFPSATELRLSDLPAEIRDFPWPAEYLA
jgi:hypothetical protein